MAGNIIVPLRMENRLGGVGHQHIPGLASSSFHPWGWWVFFLGMQ